MRLVATSIILASMTVGAQASSIVTVGPATSGPSMIVLGSADEPARSSIIVLGGSESPPRPSVVALGEPVPNIDDEEVAAIPAAGKAAPRPQAQLPMVMRGGIAGDAFVRAESASPVESQEEPAPATDPEQAQAPDGGIRLAPPDEPPAPAPEEVQDGPVLR